MRNSLRISIITILLLISGRSYTQRVYRDAQPLGIDNIDLIDNWYELAYNKHTLDSLENISSSGNYPLRFGLANEVSLTPDNSGILIEKSGDLIWYLPVKSTRARSLNVIFSKFRLSSDEQLFIYNSSGEMVIGPLTTENNNASNLLAVLPVYGDELIIEFHFRKGSTPFLEVGQITHDYIGVVQPSGKLKDEFYGASGPCNIDINCSLGDDWQVEKRSVVRILVNGQDLGSGAMINNSNQENIPYILTAEHLINSQFNASRSIFIFEYESQWCSGFDGHIDKSISGSDLVATNGEIDLTLVKLSSFPPITYKPYMAGWDARAIFPINQVTIHHPSADVKKISVDLNPPVVGTYEEMKLNGFWKILQWDFGTTEGGSSGAPLFNQDHRIIGYLTGGEAFCGHSVNDYFARFDIAYDLSTDMFKSLKSWLDPAQSGIMILDGRDPYESNFITSDTLINVTEGDTLVTKYSLPATGYTTGFNSDSILAYSESFTNSGIKYLTEIIAFVGKSNYTLASDSITFFLYESVGNLPGPVIASKGFRIRDNRDSSLLSIDFRTPVPVEDNFFVGYRVWYTQSANSEAQQFNLFHSSETPPGENTVYFLDETGWHPFTDHPYDPSERHMYISVVLVNNAVYNGIDDHIPKVKSNIYPNPFTDKFTIQNLQPGSGEIKVTLFSMQGIACGEYTINNSSEIVIDKLNGLSPGVYFLRIRGNEREEVHKIIKQ